MSKQFEYKGYLGSADVDIENEMMFGRLLFIRDVITYKGTTVAELKTAFEEAVDDYLQACAEDGTEADVPCKGSFNVRVGPDMHRKIAVAAREVGVGLNEYVCSALERSLVAPIVLHKHEVSLTWNNAAVISSGSFEAVFSTAESDHQVSRDGTRH